MSRDKQLQRFDLCGSRCIGTCENYSLEMPLHTEIICFGEEFNQPYLYVMVDQEEWAKAHDYQIPWEERAEYVKQRRFLAMFTNGYGDLIHSSYMYGEEIVLDPIMPGMLVLDNGGTRMFLFEVL